MIALEILRKFSIFFSSSLSAQVYQADQLNMLSLPYRPSFVMLAHLPALLGIAYEVSR
jgi:hypothetical protein